MTMSGARATQSDAVPRQGATGPASQRPLSRLIPASADPVPASTIDEQIESAVERAIQRVLGPYLRKLSGPEPAVYTIAEAAVVIRVSEDTVSRLVKRGILPRLPHLDGKVLIPREAIERLLNDST